MPDVNDPLSGIKPDLQNRLRTKKRAGQGALE